MKTIGKKEENGKLKIVVTGGAGFIGSHIVDRLYRDNEIVIVDDMSAGRLDNLSSSKNIHLIKRDIGMIGDALQDADVVIDMAAQVSTFESVTNPWGDFRTNAYGKFTLLDAVRNSCPNAHFIFTSSRSVHGEIKFPDIADEDYGFKPESFYNTHKWYVENLLKLFAKHYKLKYTVIRPANVYGPRMPNKGLYGFLCRWISYALQDKPIPIWGTGGQVRDFTYVEDIAKAYPMVMNNPKTFGKPYLLCTGRGVTLLGLAQTIFEKVGKTPKIEYLPSKAGDIQRFIGNYGKAKFELGWTPTTDLSCGLDLTIDFVKNNMNRYEEFNLF